MYILDILPVHYGKPKDYRGFNEEESRMKHVILIAHFLGLVHTHCK